MSIKQSLYKRLHMQADECELQGKTKIAEALTDALVKNASNVRKSDEAYVYSSEKFRKDTEASLWNIVIHASDFYDEMPDAVEIQPIVEAYASQIILDLKNKFGRNDGIGAYEPAVPWQLNDKTSIEITEEN